MPDVLLAVLILFFAIVTLVSAGKAMIENLPSLALVLLVTFGGMTAILAKWIVVAAMLPWNYTAVETYPLETVNYGDGTSVQIISIDPIQKVNVTEMLHKTFPQGTAFTRKTRKRLDHGIYWIDSDYEYVPVLPTTATTHPAR